MTGLGFSPARSVPAPPSITRLTLASRGDALTPYLFDALRRRYPVVGEIAPELTDLQRYRVAALTVRPGRSRWAERFYKSGYAYELRSSNAARQLRALEGTSDVVFQVHSLFRLEDTATVLYIDCTHRQSAEFWPPWNPLRGRALEQWYERERLSYQAAAHLFAFSEPTRDSLVRDYGISPDKVTVTGAGVNLPALPDVPTVPRRQQAPTILFVGNDFVRKGGRVLLEAFERVRSVIPDARLQLVGTDPGISAQLGVEVLGRIRDRARVAELYAGASAFAIPSFFDPYPLVLLEAMAFGLPVVTTAQTGTPEMVTDGITGRVVDLGDAGQLADALLEVLQDPETAARLGSAARRQIAERFTWDRVVERMSPALDALSGGA